MREHNRAVKHAGHGVRLVLNYLLCKSPWLNIIEPYLAIPEKVA